MEKATAGSGFSGLVASRAGDNAEVLAVETGLAIPTPGADEVLVKVAAACLNPIDWKRQMVPEVAAMCAYPAVIGVDGAGIVDAVGTDVKRFKVGDRVHFHKNITKPYGAFGEYALAAETSTVAVPDGIELKDAAALPCVAWTAWESVVDRLNIDRMPEGTPILITGGAGGVGQVAVQLAISRKLRVFTTCSSRNVEWLKELGADVVIDYTKENLKERIMAETNNRGMPYVFDTIGTTFAESLECVGWRGEIVSIDGPVNDPSIFRRGITVHHVTLAINGFQPDYDTRMRIANFGEGIISLVAEGKLHFKIGTVVEGLEALKDAVVGMQQGKSIGKVVALL